ncbi:MAG: hypothetical protein M1528_00560 [Candidatus Marsarchaeota archaeon]|nr:hypothetical protein [Candidatus Marsarchaeota archaeon]MCL5115017.1 hypothetical protein [Candidatus Marsarchaeota archaeon]
MTFEDMLMEDMQGAKFNLNEYARSFKKRPHVSKSKIDAYDNAVYLKIGQWWAQKDYDGMKKRYVAATGLTYDMFLSIYDVNSRSMLAARTVDFEERLKEVIKDFTRGLKRPNLEFRFIGMQNGEDPVAVRTVVEFVRSLRIPVFEVDLFGNLTRHIAVDAYSGMSFNVLLEDRIYKPGELVNSMTKEQFERAVRPQASL